MKRLKFLVYFILYVSIALPLGASDKRLKAVGDMSLAVPDRDSRINLYQWAGNVAWLKQNDSLNWMRYAARSDNEWGALHRHWDAKQRSRDDLLFSGQKHLDGQQTFYGSLMYTADFRLGLNRAIERQPYGLDPFVLADSTQGDMTFLGPKVNVAYNYWLSPKWYLGASLTYAINRGLKQQFTRPEIINRVVRAGLHAVYRINGNLSLGLSYGPYHIQDITKEVKQPDGKSPITYRYRGEYKFRLKVGTYERTATYEGFNLRPQIAWTSDRLNGVIMTNYYYQWHELFDGTITRYYDGYFQAEQYAMTTAWRYFAGMRKNTAISFAYHYRFTDGWAREPQAGLLFHRKRITRHHITIGASHKLYKPALMLAGEVQYDVRNPDEDDYLAHQYRKGTIANWQAHAGLEYALTPSWHLRTGLIYQEYDEADVWNYFGDYRGLRGTVGFGYRHVNWELDGVVQYGRKVNINDAGNDQRGVLNAALQFRQYF
ncbi:MAG: hypothetical protein GF313_01280 [Caldithrix sp.]|nr:hypothetical protein [Caldithrix sp.]